MSSHRPYHHTDQPVSLSASVLWPRVSARPVVLTRNIHGQLNAQVADHDVGQDPVAVRKLNSIGLLVIDKHLLHFIQNKKLSAILLKGPEARRG